MIKEPDFLICSECESPCYTFEWNANKGRVVEVVCEKCGNDDAGEFQTEEQFYGEE